MWRVLNIVCLLSLMTSVAYGLDCRDYPENVGMYPVMSDEGLKIKATSQVSVPLDDQDLVIDALEEAELESKSLISKWMGEVISSSDQVSKKALQTIEIEGEGKTVSYNKVKETVKVRSSQSSNFMRGVIQLGSCYTPGKKVMVTVGIKTSLIDAAKQLSNDVNTNKSASKKSSSSQLNSVGGFSNTDRLNDF